MECPSDIFEKLWAVRDSGTSDDQCIAFAYKSLAEIDFTGVFKLSFGEVKAEHLECWMNTQDWINDLGIGLSLEDVFPDHDEDLYSEEILPCDLVKDANVLQARVLSAIRAKSDTGESGIVGIACTEITNGDRTLWLLFDDSDAWGLGHAGYIEVVEDLSGLTEANGYYTL
jgi:hypothetical protein